MNARLYLDAKTPPRIIVWGNPLSDDEFEALCVANDVFSLERTREGQVILHAPAHSDTSAGNAEIVYQLKAWWKTHRRGRVYDSSGGFTLPDTAILSPDACYVSDETLKNAGKQPKPGFLRATPDFVIELKSSSDRMKDAKAKMESWRTNGVALGWLIDPRRKRVFVYRPGIDSTIETGEAILGSGAVEGFTLDLTEVWRCYEV